MVTIFFDESKLKGRAIIFALDMYRKKGEISLEDSLAELAELAHADNYEVIKSFVQSKDKPESATYLGKGKIEEMKEYIAANNIDTLIVNDELGGIHIRNLNDIFEIEVFDRTKLILDIFASRATSKEGKLQVEVATLKYQKPRLIGMAAGLSRTGGSGVNKGLGETKLELDRRSIDNRVFEAEQALKEVKKHREVRRKARRKSEIPTVALVGYTNAGKSTVMNNLLARDETAIEREAVFEKDMLFATLDPFHRKLGLRDNLEFILIDTVGFVSKLPHSLIEAFKSTLEEAEEASLLLYVADISREDFRLQLQVTEGVISELDTKDIPYRVIFNKIDKLTDEQLEKAKLVDEDAIFVSAKNNIGMEDLIDSIELELFKANETLTFLIPFSRGDVSSYFMGNAKIISQEYTGEGHLITASVNVEEKNRYKEFVINN